MKIKYTKYFIFVFGFISCSDNNEIIDNTVEEQEEINPLKPHTPLTEKSKKEKKDLLEKGYDFTGILINFQSAREQVIDIIRFEAETKNRILYSGTTESSNYSAVKVTASQYLKSLTNKTNDNYWNPIPNKSVTITVWKDAN